MDGHNRLSSSLARLRAVRHRDELAFALNDLCILYGLTHMAFLVVRVGGSTQQWPYFCTTYPAIWTKNYVDKHYFEIDPVVDIIRWGRTPVDWSSLHGKPPGVHEFFEDARSHGVGPNGLTVAIRGPGGERCLCSVASNLPTREWDRLRVASIHELHILAHYLNETVLAVTGLQGKGPARGLSRRETQCLQLLASGLIPKQITLELGISESSVRLYLRLARRKLAATTSHQAVAKASFLELIDL